MRGPSVSVVIPCFNQGQFLAEAIESVLGQTRPPEQIIVVDDGSTDETQAVADRYLRQGDGRVPVHTVRQANAGLSAARNSGLRNASGEMLLFLDADDALQREMLENVTAVAARTLPGAVIYGTSHEVDPTGRLLRRTCAQILAPDPFHALLTANRFPCHAVLVPRAAFADVGLFDVRLRACEDWEMWLRLAAAGYSFVPAPEGVVFYRRYPATMSSDYDRMWRSGLTVLRRYGRYHRHCALCRRAAAEGVRQWRHWCWYRLQRELFAGGRRGVTWPAVVKTVRRLMQDPLMTSLLVRRSLQALNGSRQ
jgi:glycosyltransferase involved in cell wall biosynthesis